MPQTPGTGGWVNASDVKPWTPDAGGWLDASAVKPLSASTPATPPDDTSSHPLMRFADMVGDLGVGAAKKLVEEGLRGGALLRKVPGVQALDDWLGNPGIDVNTAPKNTAQRIGGIAEQVGEVIAPARALTALGEQAAIHAGPTIARALGSTAGRVLPRMAVEAAGTGAISAAQGGNPVVGAALGAAGPVVGEAFNSLAPGLRSAAEKQVVQALGPTKERFKAIAEKIAPEMLKRGLRGSRESLAEQASQALDTSGQAIDDALLLFGSRKTGVQPVIDALEKSKSAFQGINSAGKVVVFEPRAVSQLNGLQKTLNELGPDARVDQVVALRRAWDNVVAQAGGFAQRAQGAIGVPLKDASEAATKRDATTAIRQLLDAEVPELTSLNKEFSFWKNVDDVLTQTMKRTQPQGSSLTSTVKEAAGQAVGSAATGGNLGAAFALGKVAKMANAVFSSPRYRLASAQAKDALAEAIAKNNLSGITTALSRIGATQSSKVGGY